MRVVTGDKLPLGGATPVTPAAAAAGLTWAEGNASGNKWRREFVPDEVGKGIDEVALALSVAAAMPEVAVIAIESGSRVGVYVVEGRSDGFPSRDRHLFQSGFWRARREKQERN